jgi:hypothetical protein
VLAAIDRIFYNSRVFSDYIAYITAGTPGQNKIVNGTYWFIPYTDCMPFVMKYILKD